ncbi:MAG: 2-oxoacid:ferredoxin oxidoreductase subunit beta [Bacteroidia bacterium]|nr:2-oxoacid:ferredoxin oxidoreductase subunit beta [Bacteroidia bacterium]
MELTDNKILFTSKELETDQEVRWCPGCGDYAILKSVQKILPDFGRPKHEFVFVSGIGCSSRFPYYMDTYGMHSIHGRATAIATGLKSAKPELSVWVITGDGDALSIGGNHLIHTLRRNPDLNILLFNNQIYGLTKGQFSPTSEQGKITKSSPVGVADMPFNPLALALGANGTFIARTMDRDPKHQQEIYKRAYYHAGTSLVEIYQNCNVFNDGTFELYTEKTSKPEHTLFLEHGKPLIFNNATQGIVLDGMTPKVVDLIDNNIDHLWVHDEKDMFKAYILARFSDYSDLPRPFGIFYIDDQKSTFDGILNEQINERKIEDKTAAFNQLLISKNSWVVE